MHPLAIELRTKIANFFKFADAADQDLKLAIDFAAISQSRKLSTMEQLKDVD